MAPSSAALALKAAALVFVLGMLVVPSLGRCGHSLTPLPPPPPPPAAASAPPPPAPLPPTPAPTSGPGPTISCDDCRSQCYTPCANNIAAQCSSECDYVEVSCNSCKNARIENCKANCTGSCDCNEAGDQMACTSECTTRYCDACKYGRGQQCRDDCSKQCSAPNCIPRNSEN